MNEQQDLGVTRVFLNHGEFAGYAGKEMFR